MSRDEVRSDIGKHALVPLWLLKSGVSATGIKLYAVMDAIWADNETGELYPNRRTLAENLGVKSTSTVDLALADLQRVGAITVHHRVDVMGDPTSNLYTIHHVQKTATPLAENCPTPPLPKNRYTPTEKSGYPKKSGEGSPEKSVHRSTEKSVTEPDSIGTRLTRNQKSPFVRNKEPSTTVLRERETDGGAKAPSSLSLFQTFSKGFDAFKSIPAYLPKPHRDKSLACWVSDNELTPDQFHEAMTDLATIWPPRDVENPDLWQYARRYCLKRKRWDVEDNSGRARANGHSPPDNGKHYRDAERRLAERREA